MRACEDFAGGASTKYDHVSLPVNREAAVGQGLLRIARPEAFKAKAHWIANVGVIDHNDRHL
jgi:hypothetical protein